MERIVEDMRHALRLLREDVQDALGYQITQTQLAEALNAPGVWEHVAQHLHWQKTGDHVDL